jgi:hypothetical protein
MPTRNPRLDWALRLAARGWPVFPLLAGSKKPAVHGNTTDRPCPRTGRCRDGHQTWEQVATTDPDRITTHWSTHPGHNIGLPTGRADLLVVDLDVARPDHTPPADERGCGAVCGAQVLARLARDAGRSIPDTFTVSTPSGGTHLYFHQPAGHTLRSTAGTLGWLIDTRGHGGYVVAPGSTTTAGHYELVADIDPVVFPVWLVHALADRPSTAFSAPRQIASTAMSAWLKAALDGETRRVATAPPGGHNKAQAIASFNLGRLVGGKHLTRGEAHSTLSSAVEPHILGSCGCTERKVMGVLAWGLDNGAHSPRHIDPEGNAA